MSIDGSAQDDEKKSLLKGTHFQKTQRSTEKPAGNAIKGELRDFDYDEIESDDSEEYNNDILDNISEAYTTWKNFKRSPKELWVILICKFFESLSFISEDITFMVFFGKEFALTEMECGQVYSMAAGLTFLYGIFFSGYLIDRAGIKACLLLGSLLLSISRVLLCVVHTQFALYLIMATVMPMGLSLCRSFLLSII